MRPLAVVFLFVAISFVFCEEEEADNPFLGNTFLCETSDPSSGEYPGQAFLYFSKYDGAYHVQIVCNQANDYERLEFEVNFLGDSKTVAFKEDDFHAFVTGPGQISFNAMDDGYYGKCYLSNENKSVFIALNNYLSSFEQAP